jgi:anti-sigma factor RsiW
MKPEEQIHRFFDDALSEEERSVMEQMIADDPSLAQTLAMLQTQQQLHQESMPTAKDHAFIEAQLSEIWAGIPKGAPLQMAPTSSLWSRVRASWLTRPLLATAAAVFVLASAIVWKSSDDISSPSTMIASVGFVHSDIPGASSMIFADTHSDWTIVWVDEPDPPTLAG